MFTNARTLPDAGPALNRTAVPATGCAAAMPVFNCASQPPRAGSQLRSTYAHLIADMRGQRPTSVADAIMLAQVIARTKRADTEKPLLEHSTTMVGAFWGRGD